MNVSVNVNINVYAQKMNGYVNVNFKVNVTVNVNINVYAQKGSKNK